jgi:hypothetical protein
MRCADLDHLSPRDRLWRSSLAMRTAIGLALLVTMVTVLASFAWAQESEGRRRVDRRLGFESPQVALTTSGAVVMLWARPHGKGHDLFVSIRDAAGHFGEATRVNDRPGSVHALPIDEARPALATGANDRVAVGWVDDRGDIFAALGHENGRRFEAPVRVNARKGNPERNFISVALDDRGTVHVVWLDARNAKRLGGELGGRFGEPERLGPATWKIDGCPMAGPVTDGERVLWRDGSTGKARIVEAFSATAPLQPLVRERDDWAPTGSPRLVDGASSAERVLLVPGRPYPRLLRRSAGQWSTWVDELPTWCLSAVILEGQLLMVGDQHGELQLEALDLP